jgi:hypothetical protein
MITKVAALLGVIGLALLLASLASAPAGAGQEVGEAPAEEMIADAAAVQGQALFLAKGCATCHRHEAWGELSGQAAIGPDLSDYRPDPEYTARWLRDPAAVRPDTKMPDLDLGAAEISALIAFLGAPETNGDCPVTRPPDQPFTPPDTGSPNELGKAYFWYGSNALWTQLPRDGVWRDLPHDKRGYTQKIFFSREGYSWIDEQKPALTISGRRLDAAGVTFEELEATNGFHPDVGSFVLIGVDIPTAGCWQITGHYQGHDLSFVVWVAP